MSASEIEKRERRGDGDRCRERRSHDGERRKKHRSRSPRKRDGRERVEHTSPPKQTSNDGDLSPPRLKEAARGQGGPRRMEGEGGDRGRRRGQRSPHDGGREKMRVDRRGQRSPHDERRRMDRRERRSPHDERQRMERRSPPDEKEWRRDGRGRDERGSQRWEGRGRGHERRVPDQDASRSEFGRGVAAAGEGDAEAEKPDYAVSGKLAAETNTYKGVVINYSEPEEARIPKTRWRLYGFKGDQTLPTLFVHRQSAYLVGRDRRVCDLPVDHPSCSKQHAVLQYRLVEYTKPGGGHGKRVRPYLIDLDSTNGSYINNERIESARYYELKERDMIKFGFSSREYVILHENTTGGNDSEEEEEAEQKTQ